MRNVPSLSISILLLCFISGCASTQERIYKINERYGNSLTTEIPGNIKQAKSIVREAAKEMKFIEREYGSPDVNVKDDNFMLITNNRLKSGIVSFLTAPMIASPSNIGVFFEYNPSFNSTKIIVTEELVPFSLRGRRADLIQLIRQKADDPDFNY